MFKKTVGACLLALVLVCPQALFGQEAEEEQIPAPPDVSAPPAGAERTASGLASVLLAEGTGTEHPEERDWVVVHYTGWTSDGEMIDSSVARGKAIRTPVEFLIPGWIEGLTLMVEGEKRRLWIPGDLAYDGQDGKPQGTLVFDVELVELANYPEAPPDVAAPPADAIEGRNGLRSKVLREGTGTERPRSSSHVVVHYSGWTTDGELFDTTVLHGKAASFPLDQVIRGWQLGVQEMVEGEIRRMWIPAKLAYKGQKDKPQGMLVFDIELRNFE